jgi:hypothetical protein
MKESLVSVESDLGVGSLLFSSFEEENHPFFCSAGLVADSVLGIISFFTELIFSVNPPNQVDFDFSSGFGTDGFESGFFHLEGLGFSASSFLMFFIPCGLALFFSCDFVCDLTDCLAFHRE